MSLHVYEVRLRIGGWMKENGKKGDGTAGCLNALRANAEEVIRTGS
jgi:hypothetical protein